MASQEPLKIKIIAEDNAVESSSKETLAHIYPGVSITTCIKVADLTEENPNVVIVDSSHLTKEKLESLLKTIPKIPTLIILPDGSKAKNYRHLLSGRREMISREGVQGLQLIQAIHHLLERQLLHEQLKKAAHHLKDASIRDDLTRLYNHHHFNEMLNQEVKKATRYNRPLGLLIIDLKNFSGVNEVYGHTEGDRLLAKAAGLIRDTVRDVDIPARFGDNAFAVILPESNMNASVRAGERILKALSELQNVEHNGDPIISVCIGVASSSKEVESKEEILRAALAALTESKKRGKLCTNCDLEEEKRDIKENRQIIDQLNENIISIAHKAERSVFQSILRLVNEIPCHKKQLISHAERVSFFAQRLADKACATNGNSLVMHRAGLLHDIGKIAIDEDILTKTTNLSPEEWDLMHKHPELGTNIIKNCPFLSAESDIILNHHERFDGKGYPSGLKGNEIPIGARIISVTEAWDIMTSPQPYRSTPLPLDTAIHELRKGAGTQFDPELVELFASLITG